MKALILALSVVLTGCSTAVPVTAKWPESPGQLMQEPCPSLERLPDNPQLSQVATIVSNNYTTYYQCAIKLEAWQKWYQEQKVLFERLR
jgi:hypothetical protein